MVAKDVVHVESACSRRRIAKDILQLAVLSSLHSNDAMAGIDTRIDGLNRLVDVGSMNITPKDVVAHLKRNLLTIVEGVLDDYDRPHPSFPRGGFWIGLFPLGELKGGREFDSELLFAFAANEDETLAGLAPALAAGYRISRV